MSNANNRGIVLVTGAAGFTGSTAVDYLLQHGYPVLATDLPGSDFGAANAHKRFIRKHPDAYRNVTLEIMEADLTERASLRKLFDGRNVRYILHPAALFDRMASRGALDRVNVGGTCNLLDAASTWASDVMGVAIWSTATVYPPSDNTVPITEDHPVAPSDRYAESKLNQENAALEYERDGMPLAILRPAAVYGPRSEYALARALAPLSWGGIIPMLPVPGSGTSIYNSVHIDDVVGAAMHLIYCMGHQDVSGKIFNVADGTPCTFKQMFSEAARQLHVHVPLVHTPDAVVDVLSQILPRKMKIPFINIGRDDLSFFKSNYVYDNSRLIDTGFSLKYPGTKLGLKITLEWYARNNKLDRVWYLTHPNWKTYWNDILPHERAYADYALAAADDPFIA